MKIATFNIRCHNDKNGHSIEERAPRLFKVLESCSADIIALQEARPVWMSILEERYSKDYYIFNKYRDLNAPESCPILFKKDRFNLLDKGYFWFSKTPWVESFGNDTICNCKRICEWVYLKDKDTKKQFYILNLHFGFGDSYQVESVRLLKQTTDALATDNVVICGDFNMTTDSLGYKEAVKYYTDVNTVTANYKGVTFHNYGNSDGSHIDYFFFKKGGLNPIKYKLLDETFDRKYPSDHYGILVEFN
ncbi:MAG: endonuclease/exonuclease/phosphatase family protein [Clostridia bacterium]|nr:endonuclease/exonuclease/phosphatase family protein [Clostridia bacterium]